MFDKMYVYVYKQYIKWINRAVRGSRFQILGCAASFNSENPLNIGGKHNFTGG
ncbi:hypothetical protein ACOZ9X_07485 [Fictibacillus nanhaiensis]